MHHDTIPIAKHRLGEINVSGVEYGESFSVNGVKFSLHPAGHVIGSAMVRVEHQGEVWVFSGDYKTEADGVSAAYQPVECHTFITECTFGLPAFKWKPQDQVMREINEWWKKNREDGRTSVLFAYALGKAQRVMKYLDTSIGDVYTHGAIENLTEVLRPMIDLPETTRITRDTKKNDIKGNIVIAPPSAHGTTWIRKMVPYVTASASGWMTFRGTRRRRAIDQGFVLSDHCDWDGLLYAIRESRCEKVICTHGYSDIFSRYLTEIGYDGRTAETQYETNDGI
jgi:putative mRNA 3-end processing factor